MRKGYHGNSSLHKQNHNVDPQAHRICFTFWEELFLADLLFVFEVPPPIKIVADCNFLIYTAYFSHSFSLAMNEYAT